MPPARSNGVIAGKYGVVAGRHRCQQVWDWVVVRDVFSTQHCGCASRTLIFVRDASAAAVGRYTARGAATEQNSIFMDASTDEGVCKRLRVWSKRWSIHCAHALMHRVRMMALATERALDSSKRSTEPLEAPLNAPHVERMSVTNPVTATISGVDAGAGAAAAVVCSLGGFVVVRRRMIGLGRTTACLDTRQHACSILAVGMVTYVMVRLRCLWTVELARPDTVNVFQKAALGYRIDPPVPKSSTCTNTSNRLLVVKPLATPCYTPITMASTIHSPQALLARQQSSLAASSRCGCPIVRRHHRHHPLRAGTVVLCTSVVDKDPTSGNQKIEELPSGTSKGQTHAVVGGVSNNLIRSPDDLTLPPGQLSTVNNSSPCTDDDVFRCAGCTRPACLVRLTPASGCRARAHPPVHRDPLDAQITSGALRPVAI